MIAAVYARKSTDQREADAEARSVARQIENARAFAEARGWDVPDDLVFADDAISGAEIKKLKSRQRLLDLIASGHAPFRAVIMRDASRFSRRDGDEAFGELKSIAARGIEIWFALDGTRFTYGDMGSNVLGFVRAEMNAEYRRQIARWTREAMVRKAKAGHVCGGSVFGYDNVRVDGHVERRINEREAAVVRRVFEMTAAGVGVKRVAKTLNEERVPCPRPSKGGPAGWAPSTLRATLRRSLYRGRIEWGKSKTRADSGERKPSKRAETEWVVLDVPQLRIVSDQLWNAAHRRIATAAATYLRGTRGQLYGRPPTGLESKHLLTGLSRCAACGSGMKVHSRDRLQDRFRYYVCAAYHNRGAAVCANGLVLPMREADDEILTKLRDYVLRWDIVEGAIEDALVMLRPHADAIDARRDELSGQLRTVQEEAGRLASAIAAGGQLDALVTALKDRERQRAALQHQIESLVRLADVGRFDDAKIRRDLQARVKEWRGLLKRQIPVARQIVTKLLGDERFVFTPRADGDWDYAVRLSFGKLLGGIVTQGVLGPPGIEPGTP